MKRLIIAAVAAALVGGAVSAAPAQGAENISVVFTAGASVTGDVYFPGLGPDVSASYTFDTQKDGIGGNRFCVGASSSQGVDTSCDLRSTGTFGPMLGVVGATCLYSTGRGNVDDVVINGVDLADGRNIKVEWPAAAGTILPFTLSQGTYATSGGTIVGQGAVQVTGAAPGTCGFGGPTTEFEVTGYAVASV